MEKIDENELTYMLISNMANVIMAKADKRIIGNNNKNGLPLTIVDTFYMDSEEKIEFSAFVQIKSVSIQEFDFELVMMKCGTTKVLVLEKYNTLNIVRDIASKQYDENGKLDIFDADRFEYAYRFVHLFTNINTMGPGRYALSVIVRNKSGIEIVLDSFYFEVRRNEKA